MYVHMFVFQNALLYILTYECTYCLNIFFFKVIVLARLRLMLLFMQKKNTLYVGRKQK